MASSGKDAFYRCFDAAQKVCALLSLFRSYYGLRNSHIQTGHVAMTAALIHVFTLRSYGPRSVERMKAQESLLTCVQALGEMSQTYKSASRSLEVLTSLRQCWQPGIFATHKRKR
jgi:hypothetical protein